MKMVKFKNENRLEPDTKKKVKRNKKALHLVQCDKNEQAEVRCAPSSNFVTYMEVAAAAAAVFGLVEGMGQVTERLREGIPPKRHETVDDNDPSSSSWKEPQRGDYPVQLCSQPHGDSLFLPNPIPIQIRQKGRRREKNFSRS